MRLIRHSSEPVTQGGDGNWPSGAGLLTAQGMKELFLPFFSGFHSKPNQATPLLDYHRSAMQPIAGVNHSNLGHMQELMGMAAYQYSIALVGNSVESPIIF